MSGNPFQINPTLTAIAIAFRNDAYNLIADGVMPRVEPRLATKEYKYNVYDLANNLTIPDTKVGRKGQPGKVDYKATLTPAYCEDHGLEEDVPQDDIDEGKSVNHDALGSAAERVTDIVALAREKRVADITFNPANYKAGMKTTLVGAAKFSDPTSDPIGVIMAAKEAGVFMDLNVMTIGKTAWRHLRTHPKIIKSVQSNGTDEGVALREAVAELFEFEEILVGASVLNVAKKGQEPTIQRAWGPHIQLQHRNKLASHKSGLTWGATMQYGNKVAFTRPDANIGLRGGQWVRVGETVDEKIFSQDLGYFIENAA